MTDNDVIVIETQRRMGVVDWIGATAEKEHGAEPVLMHQNELPQTARDQIEHVREDEPAHVYEKLSQYFDTTAD